MLSQLTSEVLKLRCEICRVSKQAGTLCARREHEPSPTQSPQQTLELHVSADHGYVETLRFLTFQCGFGLVGFWQNKHLFFLSCFGWKHSVLLLLCGRLTFLLLMSSYTRPGFLNYVTLVPYRNMQLMCIKWTVWRYPCLQTRPRGRQHIGLIITPRRCGTIGNKQTFSYQKAKQKRRAFIKASWLWAVLDFVLPFISLLPFQLTAKKVFHLIIGVIFAASIMAYNGQRALWENVLPRWRKKEGARAFLIMDSSSVRALFTLYSLSLYQLPALPSIPHPCLCWRWSTAGCEASVSSQVWEFLPPYLFLSSHWSHFLSRIQPCLSLTRTNTLPLHVPPSLQSSAASTCLLPTETRVSLSSPCQCRGHNNMWQD